MNEYQQRRMHIDNGHDGQYLQAIHEQCERIMAKANQLIDRGLSVGNSDGPTQASMMELVAELNHYLVYHQGEILSAALHRTVATRRDRTAERD